MHYSLRRLRPERGGQKIIVMQHTCIMFVIVSGKRVSPVLHISGRLANREFQKAYNETSVIPAALTSLINDRCVIRCGYTPTLCPLKLHGLVLDSV